jgi:cytochrome b subunit of formate dehydrogenase
MFWNEFTAFWTMVATGAKVVSAFGALAVADTILSHTFAVFSFGGNYTAAYAKHDGDEHPNHQKKFWRIPVGINDEQCETKQKPQSE